MKKNSPWFVYMIQTRCGKLYTGITTNIERRFQEHVDIYHARGNKGAKFFRGHKPETIVHSEICQSRSEASKREYQIKSMSKKAKISLLVKIDN